MKTQKYLIQSPDGLYIRSFQRGCIYLEQSAKSGKTYTKQQADVYFNKYQKALKDYKLIPYPVLFL